MRILVALLCLLLPACVSQQIKTTSLADLEQAIAIAENKEFPNPQLDACLQHYHAVVSMACTSNCGVATTIALKEAFSMVNATPECIVVKARLNAFFAKFGVVIPVVPN